MADTGSEVVIRITDFGLSGSMSPNPGLQATHRTGRVFFLAPELRLSQELEDEDGEEDLLEKVQLNQKADMYALGVVICWVRNNSIYRTCTDGRR